MKIHTKYGQAETVDIAKLARRRARDNKKDAELNGEIHDGGCARMLERISGWECGLRHELPSFLDGFAEEAISQSDPEWLEYKRLRKKFEKIIGVQP